jgi:hypothetical protein
MNTFVVACRREWSRLGVPEALAGEMAADLEADLDEAAADGVSPEEVLGNGYFDPESFAASWARARGIVSDDPAPARPARRRPWVVVAGALVSAVIALAGLVALAGGRQSASVGVAGVAFRRPNLPPVPGVLIGPQRFIVSHQGGSIALAGIALCLIGLLGLGIALWFGRPWWFSRRRPPSDRDIGMPSFL